MTDVYVAEGHGRRPDGTFDPGATDGIHSEQRDSKPVAQACTNLLRNAGVDVFSESEMIDDPNYRGTTARANDLGVKCVVSFHYDWVGAPPGAFMIATTDQGRDLGWAIEHRVAEAGFAIRDYPDDRDNLYLLNNSNAPAVIFECGRIGHEDIDETHEQRAMGEAAGLGILDWLGLEAETDMWQYLNIDEAFVEHAYSKGWLQPKTQNTLAYFLNNLGELQKGSKAAVDPGFQADWVNFRRAVTNGIALTAGAGGLTESQVKEIIGGARIVAG